MHVLIIPGEELNPSNTFSSVFELNQAVALRKANIEVGFISIRNIGSLVTAFKNILIFKTNSFQNLIEILKQRKLNIHKINDFNVIESVWFNKSPSVLRNQNSEQLSEGLRAFRKYVKTFGFPDIVHAHSRFLTAGLIAYEIKKKYKIPFVLTEHSSFYARKLVNKNEFKLIINIIQNCDEWITVSPQLGELILKIIPGINKKYKYLPNVLDTEFEKEFKLKIIQKKPFIFLNIASLDENKNHLSLIKAFALNYRNDNNFELHIGGKGELELFLKKIVFDLGIQNQVKFLGQLNRKDVIEKIKSSHVFVLSSIYETFGVVLIEALALGKPIVATKCGGPENIVTSENGYLVNVERIDVLAEALKKIVFNYDNFSSSEIRKDCINRFGSRTFSNDLVSIYKKIINT